MKAYFKIICLIAGLFCFWLACQDTPGNYYTRTQERDTLTYSIDDITGPGGEVSPAALRVIPGSSWRFWKLSDSTFAIMSQDTSNSLESIIREDSLYKWIDQNLFRYAILESLDSTDIQLHDTIAGLAIELDTNSLYEIEASLMVTSNGTSVGARAGLVSSNQNITGSVTLTEYDGTTTTWGDFSVGLFVSALSNGGAYPMFWQTRAVGTIKTDSNPTTINAILSSENNGSIVYIGPDSWIRAKKIR